MENNDSFQLLSTVSQVIDEILISVDKTPDSEVSTETNKPITNVRATVDVSTEAAVTPQDLSLVERVLDDNAQQSTPAEIDECVVDEESEKTSKELGYNKYMIEDVWMFGKNLLKEDDVLKRRSDVYNRRLQKKAISRGIALAKKKQNRDCVLVEQNNEIAMPNWTSKMKEEFPDLFLIKCQRGHNYAVFYCPAGVC